MVFKINEGLYAFTAMQVCFSYNYENVNNETF